jgi:hypothetical protein
MIAVNNPMAGHVGCNGNPGALIYAVTTNDCPCAYGSAYSSLTCMCEICRNYLQGCINCTVLTICQTCDTADNFYLDPSGVCLCPVGTDTCDPVVCGDGYVRNP